MSTLSTLENTPYRINNFVPKKKVTENSFSVGEGNGITVKTVQILNSDFINLLKN